MVRGIEDRLCEKGESRDTLSFCYFLPQEMLWAGCALLKASLLLCIAEMQACGGPVRQWPQVTEVTETEA